MLKSPLNYAGSKHDLMEQLLQHFPSTESVDVFYDVFAGGLSVSMNTNYKKTIANDIIKPLIEFYYNLNTASKRGLVDDEILKIKSFAINKESQEEYNKIRQDFNETGNPYQFFALVSSCTNNMMRFNKSFKFNQSFGKRTINDSTVQKLKDYCNVLVNKDIYFSNFTYQDLFKIQPVNQRDFVYLDPPYMISEAGYNAYWSKKSEESLYDLLDELDSKGIRFVMSNLKQHKGVINPYLHRIDKFQIIELDYDYEKVARKKGAESIEIIVKNF
jgi:DNA adenine methylase Dam